VTYPTWRAESVAQSISGRRPLDELECGGRRKPSDVWHSTLSSARLSRHMATREDSDEHLGRRDPRVDREESFRLDDAACLLLDFSHNRIEQPLAQLDLSTRKLPAAIYDSDGTFSNGQPTGYRIDTGDGSARGAVEVLKPGRVWFPKDMDDAERNKIACLYVGLMLYMPPDDH
jgi:hypothetical protein